MKVSIIQYDTAWKNTELNLLYLDNKLKELCSDTELVVLSEMFTTGVCTDTADVSETMTGNTVKKMRSWAATYDIAICGSLLIAENGKFYNRFLFVTPQGEIQTYDKRHLFRLGGEDKIAEPGTSCDIIEYKGWRIKPQICYDLRFPVWARNTENYDMLIYVSNWPKGRNLAYETLLRARALENQAYVVAGNRIGVDGNKIVYSGKSIMIDAKGLTIQNAEDKECIISADLSKNDLDTFRQRFPVLSDGDDFDIL